MEEAKPMTQWPTLGTDYGDLEPSFVCCFDLVCLLALLYVGHDLDLKYYIFKIL